MKPIIFYSLLSILLLMDNNKVFGQSSKATLNHIAIYVLDLKKSSSFYRDIIGLDTIPEPFHDGKHTWFSIGFKNHLHLIEGLTEKTTKNKNTHVCFSVSSVDKFTELLKTHEIEYENWAGEKMQVTTRVDGVKQIYFKDPDGYWIEINDAKE